MRVLVVPNPSPTPPVATTAPLAVAHAWRPFDVLNRPPPPPPKWRLRPPPWRHWPLRASSSARSGPRMVRGSSMWPRTARTPTRRRRRRRSSERRFGPSVVEVVGGAWYGVDYPLDSQACDITWEHQLGWTTAEMTKRRRRDVKDKPQCPGRTTKAPRPRSCLENAPLVGIIGCLGGGAHTPGAVGRGGAILGRRMV